VGAAALPTSLPEQRGSSEQVRRQAKKAFYSAPIGTGPFVWDTWTRETKLDPEEEQELLAGRHAVTWDSVTWQTVRTKTPATS